MHTYELTKKVKELLTLRKEIEDTKKWRDYLCSCIGRVNSV